MMTYYGLIHGETEPMQITKEEARWFLESCYVKAFVDDIINNDKIFKLHTPTRMVWTKSDDGYVPDQEGVFDNEGDSRWIKIKKKSGSWRFSC